MTALPAPTVETLAVQINGLSRLLDERFQTQRREIETADRVLDAWKATTNEMRAMLSDTLGTRIGKEDYEARHRLLEQSLASSVADIRRSFDELLRRVEIVEKDQKVLEGAHGGRTDLASKIGLFVLAAVAVVGLFLHLFLGKAPP